MFLEDVGKTLNFKSIKDYYRMSHKIIQEAGGNALFHHYSSVGLKSSIISSSSLVDIVKSSFPEHHWNTWEFETVPPNFWAEPKNRRDYFEWLGKQMGFKVFIWCNFILN